MKLARKNASSFFLIIFSLLWVIPSNIRAEMKDRNIPSQTTAHDAKKAGSISSAESGRKIRSITVQGNELVPAQAILQHLPYRVGETFNKQKRRTAIRTVYFGIKKLRHVELRGKDVGDDQIDLIVVVQESPKLKEIIFKGNSVIPTKDLRKKLNLQDIQTIEKEELKRLANEIKKLYADKNYHTVEIKTNLTVNDNQAIALFNISEGKKSIVKRVRFKGNKGISGKQLRGIIFTREDWLLGFMDKSGSYSPERLEADKRIIEQYYQTNGFLTAKVTETQVEVDPKSQFMTITFFVQEGEIYTVKEVKSPGNDLLKEDFLLARLPIKAGQIYSREKIVDSIKLLELIWGEFGHINASVEPSVIPDEATRTVSVTFYSELGNKVFLNRINIIGNKKTRDHVIRRKIPLEEGNLITTQHMEDAKSRIEALGFFDSKEGVNWKVRRISEGLADLDLFVKEEKTGHAHLKFGFGGGGDLKSPVTGLSVGGEIVDTNLFGKGMAINLNASISKEERNIMFNLTEPWLFDKPITAALDLYHKRPSYDDLKNTNPVNEILTGGSASAGFFSPFLYDSQVLFRLGFDSIRYEQKAKATVSDKLAAALVEYQNILDQQFISGEYVWFGNYIGQDYRNHPLHTFSGYRWGISSRFGFPTFGNDIGFYKIDLDTSWYTSLIGDSDLVLKLHGFFGITNALGNNRIPYRELFHIGGPASIRGFLFGQAGPKWQASPISGKDSIGGRKAFFVNAELIFPIKSDMTMKGVFFYDGGTGWDNPLSCQIDPSRLVDNKFTYRHAVGIGIRLMQPAPIKIDWGFKLDPRKRLHETASEIHFGMTYDW